MIRIKKGLNLPIAGKPERAVYNGPAITEAALLDEEYAGMRPSMKVKEDDAVKKGQALFEDKKDPNVVFTTPASGKVSVIHRGEKHIFQSAVTTVEDDDEVEFERYASDALTNLSGKEVYHSLTQSGLWTALRTRLFSEIPAVDAEPFVIFANTMDTSPPAADPVAVIKEAAGDFGRGSLVLSRLTERKIHVYRVAGVDVLSENAANTETHELGDPHPAGLSGTYIHSIEPVGASKTVWTISYQDVVATERLSITDRLSAERVVTSGDPQVNKPCLLRTVLDAKVSQLITSGLVSADNRVISGSVLSGTIARGAHNYLGRYHNQISAIEEDRSKELFGRVAPQSDKYSITHTTLGHFLKNRLFKFTTAVDGGDRVMAPIGTCEHVMPLDILPTLLLCDLIVGDTDSAQASGYSELDEEDLTLCSFVCPGKYEYDPPSRKMLETIKKEGWLWV